MKSIIQKSEECDVDVYQTAEGTLACLACTLWVGYNRHYAAASEMIGHLTAHRALGDKVPTDLIKRVREIERETLGESEDQHDNGDA